MKIVFCVGVGAFCGGIFRYGVLSLAQLWSLNFPLETLLVNVLGSLLMGFLAGFFQIGAFSQEMKSFLMIGLLGGFTTFSSFSMETVMLFQLGEYTKMLVYLFTGVFLPILAALAGVFLSSRMV